MRKGLHAGDFASALHRLRPRASETVANGGADSTSIASIGALVAAIAIGSIPRAAHAQATDPSAASGAPAATTATTASAPSPAAPKDELPKPDYIPGYRPESLNSLGMSPYVPRVGGQPGGVTPSYGAAIPSNDWTFRWTGFLTASLQASANNRVNATTQQSTTVFHAPPTTVDEYGSFVGTNTVPGQWAQLNFAYGNRYVTANLSLTTWNPTDPTTFYQIGSQQFINNIFLSYNPAPVLGVRIHAMVGYFTNAYGSMGQYGLGMYTNAMIGSVRGVGENLALEYDLTERTTIRLEDGVMGDRNGMGQVSITPLGQNGAGQPVIWPSAWIHHAHVGVERRGDYTIRLGLHYLTNWSQDDRLQTVDNLQTRPINEAYVPDSRIVTYGADAAIIHPILGYLGAAYSYTRGTNAYPLKGLITFGGEGDSLTNRWFGQITGGGINTPVVGGGTGTLVAAGINYAASLGRILSYPVPFNGDGPDLSLQVGWIMAESYTDFQPYDRRFRQKFGADLIYTFLPNVAVALRGDAVFPNSKDSGENFYVLAPRLVFKSDWGSRDTLSLIYGKWFYGPRSHADGNTITPGDRLDDQLFAVNVQMWW